MMKFPFLFSFLVVCDISFAQCIIPGDGYFSDDTLYVGTEELWFGEIYAGIPYSISAYGDIPGTGKCKICRTELKEVEISDTVKKAVRAFIEKKSGKQFLDNCRVSKILLITPPDKKKYGERNYHYEFDWSPQKNIDYCFGITIDEQGNVLSDIDLPKLSGDSLYSVKNLCEIYASVLQHYPKCAGYSISLHLRVSRNKKTMYYEFDFSDASQQLAGKGMGCHNYYRYTIKADLFSGEISKMKKSKGTICID